MIKLPKLLDQLDKHFGLSHADKTSIRDMRIKHGPESIEALQSTVEANKQHMVHMLAEVRKLSIQIIVLEDMIRAREEFKKNASKP